MTTQDNSFVAFFSYARLNDEHDRGKLTLLRKLLQSEVWVQTGKPYQIFQDQEHIEWGQDWTDRIRSVLQSSSLLIAIVSPSYLVSSSCRFEFEYFLGQESQLKRRLILPILYIDAPGLKDKQDEIAVELSKRQWVDWRDLRFASLTSSKMTRKLESLARQIRDLVADQTLVTKALSQVESALPPDSVLRETSSNTLPKILERNESTTSTPLYLPNEEYGEEQNPRQITVTLRTTGDKKHDKRRIKTIYGILISFHGRDRFSLQIFENGSGHLIDFPHDTTRICPELIDRLKKLMGEESWRVEEITFQ